MTNHLLIQFSEVSSAFISVSAHPAEVVTVIFRTLIGEPLSAALASLLTKWVIFLKHHETIALRWQTSESSQYFGRMVQNKGSLSLSMLNGWTFHPLQILQLKSTEARLARYQKAEQFMGCKLRKLLRSLEKGCKVISFFSVRKKSSMTA